MKKLALILITATSIVACTKDDDGTTNDDNPTIGEAPKITINSPANNSSYKNGDTMYINALATDDKSLENAALIVKHQQTGFELFRYDANANGEDSLAIDTFYKINSPIAATGRIIIEATDGDNNKTDKEVTITITN